MGAADEVGVGAEGKARFAHRFALRGMTGIGVTRGEAGDPDLVTLFFRVGLVRA